MPAVRRSDEVVEPVVRTVIFQIFSYCLIKHLQFIVK